MDRRCVATSLAAAAAGAATARADVKGRAAGARPSFVETDDGASLFYLDWGTGKRCSSPTPGRSMPTSGSAS
jgi:hypothetical protein